MFVSKICFKHVHTQNKTMDIQKKQIPMMKSFACNIIKAREREREVVARNDTVNGRNQAVYPRIYQAFYIPGG